MKNKKQSCGHPQMCSTKDSFKDRIKTDKLALETPPPDELVKKE